MDNMKTIVQVTIFFLCMITGAYSQCSQIKFKNSYYNPSTNGIYYEDYNHYCDGRDVYIHESGNYYMFHLNGYWYIHDEYCSSEAFNYGYFRALDYSYYPEYILLSIWWERSGTNWYSNPSADADCYNGTDLSTGAIIGICIACIVGLALIIGIPVYICTHKKSPRTPPQDVRVVSVPATQTYSIQLPPGQQQQQYPNPYYYDSQAGYMAPQQDVVVIQ